MTHQKPFHPFPGDEIPDEFIVEVDRASQESAFEGPGRGVATRHGPAICVWTYGHPRYVEHVLLPDGQRGTAYSIFASRDAWRYRPDGGPAREALGLGRWTWGKVTLTATDAVFEADAPAAIQLPEDAGPLEKDLFNCAALRALVSDDRYGMALWTLQLGPDFLHDDPSIEPQGFTHGDAGAVVANLRGLGEYYLDYKLNPQPNYESAATRRPELLAMLAEMGWYQA